MKDLVLRFLKGPREPVESKKHQDHNGVLKKKY